MALLSIIFTSASFVELEGLRVPVIARESCECKKLRGTRITTLNSLLCARSFLITTVGLDIGN